MNCPHCGSPAAEGSSFCGECGERIKPPLTPAAGSSAQPSGSARRAPTRLARRILARRRVLVVVGVVIVLAVAGGTFAWVQRSGPAPSAAARTTPYRLGASPAHYRLANDLYTNNPMNRPGIGDCSTS